MLLQNVSTDLMNYVSCNKVLCWCNTFCLPTYSSMFYVIIQNVSLLVKTNRSMFYGLIQNVSLLEKKLVNNRCCIWVMTVLLQTLPRIRAAQYLFNLNYVIVIWKSSEKLKKGSVLFRLVTLLQQNMVFINVIFFFRLNRYHDVR